MQTRVTTEPRYLARPVQGKKGSSLPHTSWTSGHPGMHRRQPAEGTEVEVPERISAGGPLSFRAGSQRCEEELGELPIDQRPVCEGIAQDELVPAQPGPVDHRGQDLLESGQVSDVARNDENRQ